MIAVEPLMIDGAPRPVGPFCHAVRAGDFVFVTGQMPTDPATGEVVGDDVVAQARQVMTNLQRVVEGAGSSMERIVFARVYLTRFERDFADFNAYWAAYFPDDRRPARTTVGVTALAVGALVEVDLVAAV